MDIKGEIKFMDIVGKLAQETDLYSNIKHNTKTDDVIKMEKIISNFKKLLCSKCEIGVLCFVNKAKTKKDIEIISDCELAKQEREKEE